MVERPALEIRTLGKVGVAYNGLASTRLGTRKTLALLVYLACQDGPAERQKLAAMLWEDAPEANARASLSVALSDLRKQLPGYIVADRERVELRKEKGVWLDASALVRRWKDWQKEQRNDGDGGAPTQFDRLEQIVALYQGDFLDTLAVSAGSAFEEWVRFERERIRQVGLCALEALANLCLARDRYEQGLVHARRLLYQDPYRESAHRLVMLLLAHQGQRAAALAHYRRCRRLLVEDLGVTPAPEVEHLRARLEEMPPMYPLPARPVFTAGRDVELEALQQRLHAPGCRLLVLGGISGIGKTHLAVEVAWRIRDSFLDGVCFLAAPRRATDADLTLALARALGMEVESMGNLRGQVGDYLRHKEMLLLIDGLERVQDPEALLHDLLSRAPALKIMVTSQGRLDLPEACVEILAGLSCPGEDQATHPLSELAANFGAIELFCTEGNRLDLQLADTEAERAALIRICRRVDGLPLGIQLAATWLPLLTCVEIDAELERGVDFLVSQPGAPAGRQQQLSGLLAHTVAGLTEEERRVLLELSVFAGSFDRQAAQCVAGAGLTTLLALVEKFLVRRYSVGDGGPAGVTRYFLPDLLRQYAWEQLRETPARARCTASNHAAYYSRFVAERGRRLRDGGRRQALREIGAELENIRNAWAHAVAERQLLWLQDALEGLALFCLARHRYLLGEALCLEAGKQLPQSEDAHSLRCHLLAWHAVFVIAQGNTRAGKKLLRKSLRLLEAAGRESDRTKGFIYLHMSRLACSQNLVEAAQLCRRALTCYETEGDAFDVGSVLAELARICERQGEGEEALTLYAVAVHHLQGAGARQATADLLGEWASVLAARGDFALAEVHARQAHALYQQIENRAGQGRILQQLGHLLIWQGQWEEAALLLVESLALFHKVGHRRRLPRAHTLVALARANQGDYEAAIGHLHHALDLSAEMADRAGRAQALWLFGWINLAKRCPEEAHNQLLESIALYRQLGERVGLSHSQAALACVEVHLGDLEAASRWLSRSLALAGEVRYLFSALAALSGAILLFAQTGRMLRAVELYTLSSRYAVAARSQLRVACIDEPLTATIASLPQAERRAARKQGQSLELWETVEVVCLELSPVALIERDKHYIYKTLTK